MKKRKIKNILIEFNKKLDSIINVFKIFGMKY